MFLYYFYGFIKLVSSYGEVPLQTKYSNIKLFFYTQKHQKSNNLYYLCILIYI